MPELFYKIGSVTLLFTFFVPLFRLLLKAFIPEKSVDKIVQRFKKLYEKGF